MYSIDYIIEKLLLNPLHNTAAPPPPLGSDAAASAVSASGLTTAAASAASGGGTAASHSGAAFTNGSAASAAAAAAVVGNGRATPQNYGNSGAQQQSLRASRINAFLHPTIMRGTGIGSISPGMGAGAASTSSPAQQLSAGSSSPGVQQSQGALQTSMPRPKGNPAVHQLTEGEVVFLILESRKLFMSQPMLVEIEAPVRLCGDVHGQYNDLLRLFELGGYPPENNYIFLGDYVDRGSQSLETVCLLLAYKLRFPDTFFMLRGNHETSSINRIYGFFDECKRRYSIKLWKQFTDTFNCMPVAGLVSSRILCMHGGLSPELLDLDQIRRILRPTDVPDSGLICDLLWADPEDSIVGWGDNDRGVSWTFGADVVDDVVGRFDLDLICRAHQVVDDGYQFFAHRKGITVFSAPNYCGEFDNAGAFLCVDDDLMCSVIRIEPTYRAFDFY